jgi:hypothetical protein
MTEQLINYYDDNSLKRRCFLNVKREYIGKYETWYRNGIKSSEIYYAESKYGTYHIGEYKVWDNNGFLIMHYYFYDNEIKKFTINIKCIILALKKKLLRKVRLKKNNKIYTPLLSGILIKDLILICISYI